MYYIYHIPGIKIGCSTSPDNRIKYQGFKECKILEKHADIMIASNREIELQKKYGYPVDDIPYYKTFKLSYLPKRLEAVKNSKLLKDHAKKTITAFNKALTFEQRSINGKKGGLIAGKIGGQKNIETGHIQNLGKKQGKINKDSGFLAKIGLPALERARLVQRTCPYCNRNIKGPQYFQWHGEKCKLNKK